MNQTKLNTESPNKNTSAPNKESTPTATTLAKSYEQAWATLFNKLSKGDQEIFLRRLKAAPEIIRGKPVTDPQVNRFVKDVISLGESYHAIQEKKAANAAKQS